MLYELINMSDPYTFKADDLECAALATILLGRGQYGAKPLDGQEYDRVPDHGVPIMVFNGPVWFENKFGKSIPDAMDVCLENLGTRAALVRTLRSVVIGRADIEARAAFDAEYEAMVPEIREEWRAKRHDEMCSSLNDIGDRALKMAQRIEDTGSFVGAPIAPQQVF